MAAVTGRGYRTYAKARRSPPRTPTHRSYDSMIGIAVPEERDSLKKRHRRLQRSGLVFNPTPIYISSRVRALLVLLLIVCLALIAYASPSVPIILIGGILLALILHFPVNLLAHLMPRGFAILCTFLGLVVLIILAFVGLVPLLAGQLTALINNVPDLAQNVERDMLALLRQFQDMGLLSGQTDKVVSNLEQDLVSRGQEIARAVLSNVIGAISSTVNWLFNLFGMFFIGIYLLVDIRRFKAIYLHSMSKRYRRDALQLWEDIGHSLSRYLAGLSISLIEQGTLATIALLLIGIPYAVVLGVWMSVTAILPYVGAFIGAIPAVAIALFISPTKALLTALAYVAINQIDGNFVTPRVQGQALKAHPIVIFLAIIAGGEMFGIAGAVLALPTVAVLRVLLDFLRVRIRVAPGRFAPGVAIVEGSSREIGSREAPEPDKSQEERALPQRENRG